MSMYHKSYVGQRYEEQKDVREFVRLVKNFDEKKQMGLLILLQGAALMTEKSPGRTNFLPGLPEQISEEIP